MRSTQALFPFDAGCATHPGRLFARIAARVYLETLLVPVISLACMAIMLLLTAWPLAAGRAVSPGIQVGLWLLALFPLVIAAEEFCHAAACLGRGKPDRVQGLVVGRFYLGRVPLSFGFAGVDIQGRLNQIDKLYISTAGPLTTFLFVVAGWAVCLAAGAPGPLRLSLLMLAAVPLVSFIPNRIMIQSDGYAISDAFRKLKVPRGARLAELARAVTFPLRWLLRPRHHWPDEFVSPAEAYRAIERELASGLTWAAIDWYQKLIRIDPYNAMNHNNLAWLFADVQQYADAYRHARRARALAPADPDVADTWKRLEHEHPEAGPAVRSAVR